MTIDPNAVLARATPEGEAEYQALITRLRQYWSDLEPIPKQPRLARFDVQNGVWVVGRRDHHAESGTYRTYLVYRRGYIPFIFLGAYRVYETPRGALVFVGKHALPSWARLVNAAGIAALGGLAYATVRIARELLH